MSLLKPTGSLFPSFPTLFDEFFGRDFFDSATLNFLRTGNTLPAVNVKETDDAFHLEVAAPGMAKEDFKIEVDNNILTISSEKESQKEEKDEKGNYTRREFSYQSFRRSFTLPERIVDVDKIGAKYVDGILHISIPKKEEAKPKPAKKIDIA
ncbi:MAG: Hsp20/alpha crystallin family protein [Bacteroidia bacterium]|nr:Hsp20/alpha crystallin family protein [Bacteroidia bacterium]MDW8158860.1 Hsp20/alpha crystallin family protein [Bacteroidia bacterium]